MDIYDAIESDHKDIRARIAEVRHLPKASDEQAAAVRELASFLTRHHEAEERTFFSELVKHDEARHEGFHMIREHGEHEKLLEQLTALEPGGDRWDTHLSDLLDDIEHHIDEEEEDIFPAARKVIDGPTADELGAAMGRVNGGLARG